MNVLVVGLGSIAHKHVKALRIIDPLVNIFALRYSTEGESYDGIVDIFDFDDLIALEFAFAIVSNPTSEHASTIEKLVPFKIPLFIEKPLFHSLKHRHLLSVIKLEEIDTYVACNLRFLESLCFAKNFIKTKRINEVNIYCGSYLPDWRPHQDFRELYSAHKNMGGGVHIDLIHEIDYAYWFFGKPLGITKTFDSSSSLSISAIDYANYLFKYEGFSTSIILNYYRRDSKRSMEIICEDGTLQIDLLKNAVYWNSKLLFESAKGIQHTYLDQLRFFLDCINEKKILFNDIHEAFEILELCLAND